MTKIRYVRFRRYLTQEFNTKIKKLRNSKGSKDSRDARDSKIRDSKRQGVKDSRLDC